MATDAGRYRHQVTIRGIVEGAPDPLSGQPSKDWGVLYENVPAEVLTGPGREGVAAGAERAETDARINLRWLPGIDTEMRVIWESEPNGQRPEFAIQTMELDATGMREIRLRCVHGRESG
ncbi:head-tail adaptor protein [Stenotrophomonas sp. VV52]|uniref:head-tail adaptor protein n=1 Tax=Stenotrophomonas sp. VV52 TaxID=2066958 RepID=UPI000C9E3F75|nr:head-tail adaptor protein [Stenotrophomonas sp. VV52]